MKRKERCGDCVCWDLRSGQDGKGFCRAKAPAPTVVAKASEYTLVVPSTGRDDFCIESFVPFKTPKKKVKK